MAYFSLLSLKLPLLVTVINHEVQVNPVELMEIILKTSTLDYRCFAFLCICLN